MHRFLVVQLGARLHYGVPAVLAKAGMLERFYTDICADVGPLRHLLRLWPTQVAPAAVRRLQGRRLPSMIRHGSVRTLPFRSLWERLRGGSIEPFVTARVLTDGFGRATALYVVTTADYEIVKKAQAEGLFTVHEQFLSPDELELMHEERQRFPDLEPLDKPSVRALFLSQHLRQWATADRIVAPSAFVKDASVALGADPTRVCVVPYGISDDWLHEEMASQRGRVLFVGTVGLRKGNHYLAEAARLLRGKRVKCEVRVVGAYRAHLHSSDLFEGPTYLGQVPRSQVREEFQRADVFVLPTLSEGCALAHLEAMACGVPVITTPNCGSVVRDGVDGFIVPIRDATALAEKIALLVSNRQLRAEMSYHAKERATEFTWARYGERLLRAISSGARAETEVGHV